MMNSNYCEQVNFIYIISFETYKNQNVVAKSLKLQM